MDSVDLELFEQSLAHATSDYSGHALDAALEELGWHDALAIEPPAREVVLPAIGHWDPPGTLGSDGLQVNGLGSGAWRGLEFAVVVAAAERGPVALAVPSASLTVARVDGVDPNYGLSLVTGEDIRTYTELEPAPANWTSAVAFARLALAHESRFPHVWEAISLDGSTGLLYRT
jgi:hypothetical protein